MSNLRSLSSFRGGLYADPTISAQQVASENEAAIQQLQSMLQSAAGNQQLQREIAQLFALANAVKASLQQMASGAKDAQKFDNIVAAHQDVMARLARLAPAGGGSADPGQGGGENVNIEVDETLSQPSTIFTPLNIGIGVAVLAGLYFVMRRRSGPTQISEAEMDELLASGEYELNEDCGCGG